MTAAPSRPVGEYALGEQVEFLRGWPDPRRSISWTRGVVVRVQHSLLADGAIRHEISVAERLSDGTVLRAGVWIYADADSAAVRPTR